ncbi:MAG: glycosyltransferase [Gemmatimonadaceae bacterium]|nr:glycosyltransferase [Gemmatimonadaceae bacterium]
MRAVIRDSEGADTESVALSVILPCYRAAGLAVASAEALGSFLQGRIPHWEVIVVDDGGDDFPASPFRMDWGAGGSVRLIQLPKNRGKGAAVAAGMRAATGAVRIFTDVDLPYGTAPILLLESIIRTRRIHVVIGDRTFPQSRYAADLPVMRRAASRVFSLITATLVTGGFFDTQCGLKGFRGDVADALFALQRLERFSFDVELIYLALTYGLEIKRVPVVLEVNRTSSVRIGRDSLRSMADLARLRLNRFRGRYDCPQLEELVANECSSVTETL